MTNPPVRCLGCGVLCRPSAEARGRCGACRRLARSRRTQLPEAVRRAVLAGAPWCCQCHARADLTIDHIVPLSRGGSNEPANLRVLCRSCNSRKGKRRA